MGRLIAAGAVVLLSVLSLHAGELHLRAWCPACPDPCERIAPDLLRCSLRLGWEAVFVIEARTDPAEWVEIEASGVPPWARFYPGRGFGAAEARCVLIPPPAATTVEVAFRARTSSGLDTALTLELIVAEPSGAGARPPAAEEVPWEEGRLSWDHFRGTPPPDAGGEAAQISYEIRYRCVYEAVPTGNVFLARPVELAVELVLIPERSWVRPWAMTPEVLRHEQAHFDIAEVYRRLLELSLSDLSSTGRSPEEAIARLKALAAVVFREMEVRMDRVQRLYDEETSHGRDPQAQREWERRIARWLRDPRSAP
ncbi:DUF922 domain-containing protein [Candidatus Bipolaricaulota sp. J31]